MMTTRHRTQHTAVNHLTRQGFELRQGPIALWVHRGKRLRARLRYTNMAPYLYEIIYEPLDSKGRE
jgi:hypothetical protein